MLRLCLRLYLARIPALILRCPCAKCPSDTRRLAYLRYRNMGLRTLWPVLRLSRMTGPTLVTSAVHICAAVGRFV